MKNREQINSSLAREEIIGKAAEIDNQINAGFKKGMTVEKTEELREQRKQLLSLLPEYQEIGSEKGGEGNISLVKDKDSEVIENEGKRDPLKTSEDYFKDNFESLKGYNQTMPNYFKKRSENLGEIIDELKNKNVDSEIISLIEKVVIEDRKKMVESMCRKEHIDIYYANPGSDNSNIEQFSADSYVNYLLKGGIRESEIEKQLKDVDEKLTAAVNDFAIDLFAGEYAKAASFFKMVNQSKNPIERRVYCVVIKHILDGIEKGIKDKGIKDALKNKF